MTLAQEAREGGVSRQYIWQMRRQAEGRCMACGEPRGLKQNGEMYRLHCAVHAHMKAKRNRKRRARIAAKGAGMMDRFDFDKHFTDNYNTKIGDQDEQRFQNWIKGESTRRGREVAKDLADYDLRGYWLNGGHKDTSGKGHMPDTYKKPNHPTFSSQSAYNGVASPWGEPFEGGQWAQDGSSFMPSQSMLRFTHSLDALRQYMQQIEPNVRVITPR